MDIRDEINKKIVVYTVIMGDYDYLGEPSFIMDNCDYVCFTNNADLKSSSWKIIYDGNDILDNSRWQRKHKVLAHKYLSDYEWSVYVDGNVRIIGDFREYIVNESKGSTVLCLKHPERDNIFAEAEACLNFKKDTKETIEKQIERYKQEGYDGQNGLIVSNVLVRKHMDPEVISLMEAWWDEIERGSRRDQLSFNYVCWKKDFHYDSSDLKPWKSKYWVNPGIHTSDIERAEKEIVDLLQLVDNYRSNITAYEKDISDKSEYIRLKEQELKDANTYIGWKEQELKDAKTYTDLKEQELVDANKYINLKEQELKDAKTYTDLKEQELKDANAYIELKEQELKDANTYIALKEQELKDANTYIGWKEQELKDANTYIGWKEQELKDANTYIAWKEQELKDALACMSVVEKVKRRIRKARNEKK